MDDQGRVNNFAPVRRGEAAPDFVARSTEGMVRLSDYRGRWLVFFSHPGDFTPVCTSEFVALARAFGRFEALGCSLLGHSVDSASGAISARNSAGAITGQRRKTSARGCAVSVPPRAITDIRREIW